MSQSWKVLLRQQKGLVTAAQARAMGVPPATLSRRTRGPFATWHRVLPRVYATFAHTLTDEQRVVAAWLYGGEGALVTGAAALHWRHLPYLPSEVTTSTIDIVVPFRRDCTSTEFVRVTRSRRALDRQDVDHVACASTAHAVGDAARRLIAYEPALALVTSVLNSGRVSIDDLAQELATGPAAGSGLLRKALLEVSREVRSVPEAELLRLLDGSSLPPPLVNKAIRVGGRRFVPDFRWGWLIVEVDSRLHHQLRPGSARATERRRALLEAAGYHVIPVTPEMIRDDPAGVLSAIIDAYLAYAAA